MDLIERIEHDDRGFNTDGRILRLKHHLRSTSGPRVINAIINALRHNTRVEALYLQAFEKVTPFLWLFSSLSADDPCHDVARVL